MQPLYSYRFRTADQVAGVVHKSDNPPDTHIHTYIYIYVYMYIYIYIDENDDDLTATSLEWWLEEINITKLPY